MKFFLIAVLCIAGAIAQNCRCKNAYKKLRNELGIHNDVEVCSKANNNLVEEYADEKEMIDKLVKHYDSLGANSCEFEGMEKDLKAIIDKLKQFQTDVADNNEKYSDEDEDCIKKAVLASITRIKTALECNKK